MRIDKTSLLSVCLLALRIGVAAAPTENVHTTLVTDDDYNKTSLTDGHFVHDAIGYDFPGVVAELERRRSSGSRSSRTRPKPKQTVPKKPTETKPKEKNPKVTSKPKLKPSSTKKVHSSKTKTSKDPYGSCKAKGGKGAKGSNAGKAVGKTKGGKGHKREEKFHGLEKRDQKTLWAGRIEMVFPTHPNSGQVITAKRYEREGVKAFGTTRADPCDDDYNLKAIAFPSHQGAGLATGDRWDTEHVMDAQILKQFFDYLNDHLPITGLPHSWWSKGPDGKVGKFGQVRALRYMGDFWHVRTGHGGLTAMDYLLDVYPGTNQFTSELALLSTKINRKKESIFGESAGHCIGSTTWRNLDYWGKVDALRECILLVKYMNHPTIRSSFKKVSERISTRFTAMERPGGFMDTTRNYWARKKNDAKYNDAPGEYWINQRLAAKWESWITSYMKRRLDLLEGEIDGKLREIRTINSGAQRDKNLTPQRKHRIDERYRRISAAWGSTGAMGKKAQNPSPF